MTSYSELTLCGESVIVWDMKQEETGFCPICHNVDEETINEILSFAQKINFSENENIYMEGDAFRGLFVLLEGEVRSASQNEKGKEFLIKRFDKGQVFGESGLLKKSYFESAKALSPVSCIFLPEKEFKSLVERKSQLSIALIQLMGEWIADFYDRFQTLSFTNVRDRVEHFLVNEVKKVNSKVVVLKLKRHEVASNLGIRPETLSRILTSLQNENLIKINGNNEIDLSDFKSLTR